MSILPGQARIKLTAYSLLVVLLFYLGIAYKTHCLPIRRKIRILFRTLHMATFRAYALRAL